MENRKIPLYGSGTNIRDWIYVKDHCLALWEVFSRGSLGETYCIGSDSEKKNIEVIEEICDIMDIDPTKSIEYVTDRLGHDTRYAIDSTKMKIKLGWEPTTSFEEGLRKTIGWYYERY